MTTSAPGGSGQAPAPETGNGQAPTGGATNPPATPASGNGQAPTTPEGLPTAEEWKRVQQELAEARRDAAKVRDAQKQAELAKLGDLERAQKQLADLQAAHAEYQTQAQERIVRALVRAEAASMGLNPALAARLVDFADIEFDEDGGPKNLARLLKKAAEDYGLTPAAGQGQGAPRPPVSSGGATAPGAGARAGAITKAAYQAMSAQERVARNNEVMQTLRQNGGRLPD